MIHTSIWAMYVVNVVAAFLAAVVTLYIKKISLHSYMPARKMVCNTDIYW